MRLFAILIPGLTAVGLAISNANSAEIAQPDFNQHIKPILEAACVHCHNDKEHKGDLKLTTLEEAVQGGENGSALVPGDSAKSKLFTTTQLKADDDDVMPPKKEGMLAKEQLDLLKKWIDRGAKWPAGTKLEPKPRIDFVKHVQPLLEQNCVSCHNPEKHKGELDLSTKQKAFTSGDHAP
ncbi:MAG TPA: c-type cytochrome domain-containing protein, partial [Verrucomicrobiaceae bacterium]